jgi:putative phosphoribosyl transferase
LAAKLAEYNKPNLIVLAIPNGAVPIAVEVALALKAELEVVVVRKLALPLNPEGGLGAVAEDGTYIFNEDVIQKDGLSRDQIEYEAAKIKANVRQRSLKYMGDQPRARLNGKTAIIVDDGLASGITMEVAVESVRHRRPQEVIVAVPVASGTGYQRVARVADKVVAIAVANMSRFFLADFYRHWQDIADDAVVHYLEQWRRRRNK